MNRIVKFFHELRHPHCVDCISMEESNKICNSCETLKAQLEIANYEKKLLLNLIKPTEETSIEPIKEEPIRTSRFIPWNVKRQQLEEASREAARLLKKKEFELAPAEEQEKIEELERKVGL